MKTTIKLEELGIFIGSIYFIYLLNLEISWWAYILLFFSPDIGMIGYAINSYIGAIIYNIFHHKGIAILIGMLGILLKNEYLELIGLILIAHSSFDRVLGYGLKYFFGFKYTHLGKMK